MLEDLLGIVILVFVGIFAIVGSIAADQERQIRRKNYKAGTHDYYGNKIKND